MKNTLTSFAIAAALVAACNHESSPPPKGVTTTGAGVVANEDAVRQLTNARCARAKACNQIGDNQRWKDDDACRREERHDLQSDLRPGECPRGIREERLTSCMQELQNEKCNNPFDKISRVMSCRTAMLCRE